MKSAPKKNERKKAEDHSAPEDLEDLTRDEISGSDSMNSGLEISSADEEEDEGLGDGKIGRSEEDILGRE